MTRDAIYTRVSTTDQADEGHSLDDQLAACERFSRDTGGTVVGTFTDPGKSGARLDRPGLQAMIADADGFDRLIVWKHDRLSRDPDHFAVIRHELDRHGVTVVSATEPVDDSASGKLLGRMLEAVAEFERGQTIARVSMSARARAERGLFNGGATPLGLRAAGDAMIEPTAQLPIVVEAFRVFTTTSKLVAVRDFLRGHGVNKDTTGVRKMLRSPLYIGRVAFNGESFPAQFGPFMDVEMWNRAQAILDLNRRDRIGRDPVNILMTRGMLKGACGHSMYVRTGYYVCAHKLRFGKDACQEPYRRVDHVDAAVFR